MALIYSAISIFWVGSTLNIVIEFTFEERIALTNYCWELTR